MMTVQVAEPDTATGSFSKEDYEALAQFRYGIRRYLRFSENAVRSRGITPQQYQLMLAIKGIPGKEWGTISDLAERLQLKHHSAVGLVNRAVSAGLVRRLTHPADARIVRVQLTEAGEEVLSRLVGIHRAELVRIQEFLRLPDFVLGESGPNSD